jgi:hypothetical protein
LQLGMPSLMEYKTLEQSAALCKALGLDFVELNILFRGVGMGKRGGNYNFKHAFE